MTKRKASAGEATALELDFLAVPEEPDLQPPEEGSSSRPSSGGLEPPRRGLGPPRRGLGPPRRGLEPPPGKPEPPRVLDTPPSLRAIVAADLQSNQRLSELYRDAVEAGVWTQQGERGALEFFVLAEKALADDTMGTPGRLFAALIREPESAGARVSNAIESRAMQRLPSHERYDLAASADPEQLQARRSRRHEAVFGEDASVPARSRARAPASATPQGFLHAVLAQCFLPQTRPAEGQRTHEIAHGRASLLVQAGVVMDPDNPQQFVPCPIPWGSRPRLILPYIIGEAVRRSSPWVDLGPTPKDFATRLGLTYGGTTSTALARQMVSLASCQLVLGEWGKEAAVQRMARVAEEVQFWRENDPRQRAFWRPSVVLSPEFYAAIQQRRVPVDLKHLARLASSARRQDLYVWLSYRSRTVSGHRPVRIQMADLRGLFAPGIAEENLRLFVARVKRDLKAIAEVYPGFKVSVEKRMLVIHKSRPPVPERPARIGRG